MKLFNKKSSQIAGESIGHVGTSQKYADNVVLNSSKGHGFAAEKANHLKDRLAGKKALLVGGDNVKNGADRFVDGQLIQTKYCASGSKSIGECFDKNGMFRYQGMQIEVPSDQYESAIQAMKSRIEKGQVPGIHDPDTASDIVRKGGFTYQQAKNIAKAGTIESLSYDAVNGIQIAGSAMGLTASISFAMSVWNGENVEIALQQACYEGIKVGGIAWVGGIVTTQLGRTGIEQSLRSTTDWMVKQLGSKASANIANALRTSGSNIYGGAAMNHVSKLMRGNIISGTVTTLVLSSGDLANMFQGRMSGAQVIKNMTTTASSVAGGTGGWMAGAAGGAAIGSAIPIIGTAAGGIIGGIIGSVGGGMAAGKASSAIMNQLIKEDAEEMLEIMNMAFVKAAGDYLLTQPEVTTCIDLLKEDKSLPVILKDMYASADRELFSYKYLESKIEQIVAEREHIFLPSKKTIERELKLYLKAIKRKERQKSVEESTRTIWGEMKYMFNISFDGRYGRINYLNSLCIHITALILWFITLISIFGDTNDVTYLGIFIALPIFGIFIIRATSLRLHDRSLNSWLSLLMFIPYLNILFIASLLLFSGDSKDNDYGKPMPKGHWLLSVSTCLIVFIMLMVVGIFIAK